MIHALITNLINFGWDPGFLYNKPVVHFIKHVLKNPNLKFDYESIDLN